MKRFISNRSRGYAVASECVASVRGCGGEMRWQRYGRRWERRAKWAEWERWGGGRKGGGCSKQGKGIKIVPDYRKPLARLAVHTHFPGHSIVARGREICRNIRRMPRRGHADWRAASSGHHVLITSTNTYALVMGGASAHTAAVSSSCACARWRIFRERAQLWKFTSCHLAVYNRVQLAHS